MVNSAPVNSNSHPAMRLTSLSLAVTVLTISAVKARADESPRLFASEDALQVQIAGPLTTMAAERSDAEYYQGTLRLTGDRERELKLKFRTRGNFRRKRENCRFPPLRLNFQKDEVGDTVFAGQNILKLVTHCRSRSAVHEQYVLKELLAYKVYAALTDLSFRTRLLKITWIDTDKSGRREERYGFVIEHKNELAKRLDTELVKTPRSSYAELDHRQAAVASMFQYLIGNTDFSLVAGPEGDDCCHNSTLIRGEGGAHIAVPYDFDFSGLVNASYAAPNPRFGIRRVTARLYRGACLFNEQLPVAAALYKARRDQISQLIARQEGLTDKSRRALGRFVDAFYKDLDDPKRFAKQFVNACV